MRKTINSVTSRSNRKQLSAQSSFIGIMEFNGLTLLAVIQFLFTIVGGNLENVDQQSTTSNPPTSSTPSSSGTPPILIDPLVAYQKLFKVKRAEQLGATKSILNLKTYEKKYKMVESITSAMQKVLLDGRVSLEKGGFTPGDDFPESDKETLRDPLSQVLENSAFFADLALRLPDIAPRIYRKNKEFRVLMEWAITFSNTTGFFDPVTVKLMDLAGQELGLVPKSDEYINPYKEENKKLAKKLAEELSEEIKKEAEKIKKNKKKRGPRLGGGEL